MMSSKKQKTSPTESSSPSESSFQSDDGFVLKTKKSRAKNFSEKEDTFLCKAYVNISTDARVGNNQKATVFWQKVKAKFDEQLELAGIDGVERDVKSLTTRYKRHIMPAVGKFNQYLRLVKSKKPSGTPEGEYMDLAMEMFREMEKKDFSFKMCVPILQDLVKFETIPSCDIDEYLSSDDDEIVESPPVAAVNYIAAPMGAKKPRPMGCKAAKKALSSRGSPTSSLEEAETTSMVKLVAAQESVAEAMKLQAFSKMFDMYKNMGKEDEAAAILKQMEDIVKKN